MIPTNNNIKSSAAILAFFLSAAAWVSLEMKQEAYSAPQNSSVQPGTVNAGMVLRPLTD